MPFSSLKSPSDIARAHAAVDAAWLVLSEQWPDSDFMREKAKLRLASIVAGLLQSGFDNQELSARAVAKFRETVDPDTLA